MALTTLNEFIDALTQVKTVEQIHEICSEFCVSSGFGHFLYGARVPTSLTHPSFIYVSGYPDDWRDRYVKENYICIDPVVKHCANAFVPLDWNDAEFAQKATAKSERDFMNEAKEFGLVSGVTSPVHTPQGEFALFSLATSDSGAFSKDAILENKPASLLFASYLHEAVRKVFADAPLTIAQLTAREKQCLLWAAEGKTTWETAKILKISERTVVFHVQNAAEKLNVVNRQQAIARAVSTGQISPQLN